MLHKNGTTKKLPKELTSSFILQKTTYDCSPTSIYNALVWLGINPDQTIYDRLFKICKTEKGYGSDTANVNKALRWAAKKWNFSCEYKTNLTITDIVKHIEEGHAVILSHNLPWEKPQELHHSFWFDFDDGKVLGVNVKWRRMYAYVTPFQLRSIAKNDDVWFIKKKEDE